MIKELKEKVEKFFAPEQFVDEKTVNYQQRATLLLDARNELVPAYFAGAAEVAHRFKSKAVNPFDDYLYTTCKGFCLAIRDTSIDLASHGDKLIPFGVSDIIQNRKKSMRMIISIHRDRKTGELFMLWLNPHDSKSPVEKCSIKTMLNWSEK